MSCVVCRKAWPRPRHRAGVLAASSAADMALFGVDAVPVFACDECVVLLAAP